MAATEPPAVNTTVEVYRSDGIRLYGLDAELELKMQAKRNPQFEKEIAAWIEKASGQTLEFPDDIVRSIKSGIVLCRLINVLQPGTIKTINTKPIALMEVENIQLYLKACWKLGVPSSDLFVTSDLFNQKDIPQVLQNIVSLARVAQNLPNYTGPKFGAKLSAPAPVKKWDTIETNQVVYANDIQKKNQSQQPPAAQICYECGAQRVQGAASCKSCNSNFAQQGAAPALGKVISDLKEAKKSYNQLQDRYNQLNETNKIATAKLQNLAKVTDENKALTEKLKALAALEEVKASLELKVDQLQSKLALLEGQMSKDKRLSESKAASEFSSNQVQEKKYQELNNNYTQLQGRLKKIEAEKEKIVQEQAAIQKKLADEVAKTKRLEEKLKQAEKAAEKPKLLTKNPREEPAPVTTPSTRPQASAGAAATTTTTTTTTKEAADKPKLGRSVSVKTLQKYQDMTASAKAKNQNEGVSVPPDSELDPDMLKYTKDCMAEVLFSKPIEFSDVYALNNLFSTDAGRRQFTRIMHQTMKEIPTLILSDNSFELLLYLVNTVLQQMDLSTSKDLIGAKVLMSSACTLSRRVGKRQEFIRDYIIGFEIWKNLRFWEEYFLAELTKKHRKKLGDITALNKELTLSLISSFVYNMSMWCVPKASIKQFVVDIGSRNSIAEADYKHIIVDYLPSLVGFENKGGDETSPSTAPAADEVENEHDLKEKSVSRPTFCRQCNQFIWGLTAKQGLKCTVCKCMIHKKCLESFTANSVCSAPLKQPKEKKNT